MGIEYMFLFFCLGTLAVITSGLVLNTLISGSKYFVTFQLLMSATQYNKTSEETISLLLEKVSANLVVASLSSTESRIEFMDINTNEVVAEIFIGNKYYFYGTLQKYYGKTMTELSRKRPTIKTLKRIIKLEKQLLGDRTENKEPPVQNNKKKNVVELQ